MEQTNADLQERLRLAKRQRSDALGELLAARWTQCRAYLGKLLMRQAPTNTPTSYSGINYSELI